MLQRAISLADAPSFIRYLWRVLVRYRKGQRNSELEQSAVRILIGTVLMYYFEYFNDSLKVSTPQLTIDLRLVLTVFLIASVFICISILIKPIEVPIRRISAILLDPGVLTVLRTVSGVQAAQRSFIYRWCIIGVGVLFWWCVTGVGVVGGSRGMSGLVWVRYGVCVCVTVRCVGCGMFDVCCGMWCV